MCCLSLHVTTCHCLSLTVHCLDCSLPSNIVRWDGANPRRVRANHSAQEAAAGHPHRDSIPTAVAEGRVMPASEEEDDEVEADEAEKAWKGEGDGDNQTQETKSLARP